MESGEVHKLRVVLLQQNILQQHLKCFVQASAGLVLHQAAHDMSSEGGLRLMNASR